MGQALALSGMQAVLWRECVWTKERYFIVFAHVRGAQQQQYGSCCHRHLLIYVELMVMLMAGFRGH